MTMTLISPPVLGALCATGFVVHYETAGEHYGYIRRSKTSGCEHA